MHHSDRERTQTEVAYFFSVQSKTAEKDSCYIMPSKNLSFFHVLLLRFAQNQEFKIKGPTGKFFPVTFLTNRFLPMACVSNFLVTLVAVSFVRKDYQILIPFVFWKKGSKNLNEKSQWKSSMKILNENPQWKSSMKILNEKSQWKSSMKILNENPQWKTSFLSFWLFFSSFLKIEKKIWNPFFQYFSVSFEESDVIGNQVYSRGIKSLGRRCYFGIFFTFNCTSTCLIDVFDEFFLSFFLLTGNSLWLVFFSKV